MGRKLKDTKLGKWLSNNAPKALDVVGDVLPDNGVLGVLKNIITKDTFLSEEQKKQFAKVYEHELNVLKLEQEDRDNARQREIEMAKTDAPTLSKIIVPLIAIVWVGFSFVIYILTLSGTFEATSHIQEGVITDITHIAILIVGYYFGSSKGSKDKQKHIHRHRSKNKQN